MKKSFAKLVLLVVLGLSVSCWGVNTAGISSVADKEVLDPGVDFKVIDRFLAEAVDELVNTEDFSTVVRARSVILAYDRSNRSSAQAQYSGQFSRSAYKYISKALAQAKEIAEKERKLKIIVNLLILVDGLEDVRLADIAADMLDYDNAIVRYWAVHAVSNPKIVKQIISKSVSSQNLIKKIVTKFEGLINKASPDVLVLIVRGCGEINSPEFERLLLDFADMRMERYRNWTVKDEIVDAEVLRSLCKRLTKDRVNKAEVGRRFAQLYSYVMQRYIKGREVLGAGSKRQLGLAISDVEACISKDLKMFQRTIRDAIDDGDYGAIELEHNKLLGDKGGRGKLREVLEFDYGKGSDGSRLVEPLVLPEPGGKPTG